MHQGVNPFFCGIQSLCLNLKDPKVNLAMDVWVGRPTIVFRPTCDNGVFNSFNLCAVWPFDNPSYGAI